MNALARVSLSSTFLVLSAEGSSSSLILSGRLFGVGPSLQHQPSQAVVRSFRG